MACYVEFVQTQLMPLYTMFENADYHSGVKVRYSDIWYLFRHGEPLVSGHKDPSSDSSDSTRHTSEDIDQSSLDSGPFSTADTQLWRFVSYTQCNLEWQVDDLAENPTGNVYKQRNLDDDNASKRYSTIRSYYIDFDGQAFAPIRFSRFVGCYEGEKDVTSLPEYPIRFLKVYEQIFQRLKTRGGRLL